VGGGGAVGVVIGVGASAVAGTEVGAARVRLRARVGDLARPLCGSCHQGSLPTAKAGALAVFDLDRVDWPTRMQTRQFDAFLGRIKGKLAGPELELVRAFVAAERATR
jgi:hypothetical protein